MKKVLSLAIAAALVAPAAAMAEATLFGKAHFIIQNVDDNENTGVKSGETQASEVGDVWSVDSIHSRVGVKGSEDLGNGMTAVYHFEFKVHQDDGSDGLGNRNQFIGLAGGFGTVLLGRHDTPLKMSQGKFDQFGDLPWGDLANVIPGDDRVDNVIAYVSPAFSGLTFVGALVAGEEGDSITITETTIPATFTSFPELTGFADHISLAGLYSNGPIFASLAYNQYDLGGLSKQTADIVNTLEGNTALSGGAKPTLLRATFVWDGGMWTAGAMFSSLDLDLESTLGASTDGYESDAFGLSGSFKIGANGKIKAQYLSGDGPTSTVNGIVGEVVSGLNDGYGISATVADGFAPNVSVAGPIDDTTQFSIGYEHAMSSHTTLHAGYTSYEVDYKDSAAKDREVDAIFAGMIHNF